MRILHTLSLLLALSLTAGCAHHNFEQNRVYLEADMLPLWHTNAAGRAVVHTTFVVPRKALTRRQRLIVVPQMVIGADSVVAELTPPGSRPQPVQSQVASPAGARGLR